MLYEVIHGFAGCVHRGEGKFIALVEYNLWVLESQSKFTGRHSGESVKLFENGILIRQHSG